MHARRDENDGEVVGGEFFISRSDATPLLEATDAALDDVPLPIAFLIEWQDALAIRALRNQRFYATSAQGASQRGAVVAFIAGNTTWAQSRSTAANAPDRTDVYKP